MFAEERDKAVEAVLDRLGATVTYSPPVGDDVEGLALVRKGYLDRLSGEITLTERERYVIVKTSVFPDVERNGEFDAAGETLVVDKRDERSTDLYTWWITRIKP